MILFIITIVLFAAAVNRTLLTCSGKPISLAQQAVNVLAFSYLALVANYLFLNQVFGVDALQDIRISSVSTLYLFAIWCILLALVYAGIWMAAMKKAGRKICFTHRQERFFTLSSAVFMTFFCAMFALNRYATQSVYITEICTDEVVLQDGSAKKEYVELYNPTPFSVLLTDFAITDDPEKESRRYPISGTIVPAHGYALVLIGEDAPFSIRNRGEDLYLLYSGTGQIVDQVLATDLPESADYINWVYAKRLDTEGWEIQNASPLLDNIPSNGKNLVLPEFSAEGGFYGDAFELTLSAPEGYSIYYTLDSSVPDEHSIAYTNPIRIENCTENPNVYLATQNIVPFWQNSDHNKKNVDKGLVVRAVTVDRAGRRSDAVSKTYFVDMEQYQTDLVLSVVTDYDNLIGEDGICITGQTYDEWLYGGAVGDHPPMNMERSGRDAEVPANVELFSDSDLLLNTPAGLRLQGASSRQGILKRLRLISRECYSGSRYFSFDLFDIPSHSFYTRALSRTSFADVLSQQLLLDTDIAGADAKPAHVFVNGEYWYTWALREHYNEDWISHRFDVNRKDVLLCKVLPEEIIDYVHAHDMRSQESYDGLAQFVDMSNYIRFFAANIYYNNTDISEGKNLRVWRAQGDSGTPYQDGKYRFLLYDLDFLGRQDRDFFGKDHYEVDTFTAEFPFIGNPYKEGTVFWKLKKNDQFRRDFVLTFMDMANTCFEKEHVAQLLEAWGYDRSWNDGFFDQRATYIIPHLAKAFDLTGTLETLEVTTNLPEAGKIRVNSAEPALTEGQWSGSYYTDYPVTLTAEPEEGYAFEGWYHQGTLYSSPSQEVTLSSGGNLWQAQFRKIGE